MKKTNRSALDAESTPEELEELDKLELDEPWRETKGIEVNPTRRKRLERKMRRKHRKGKKK